MIGVDQGGHSGGRTIPKLAPTGVPQRFEAQFVPDGFAMLTPHLLCPAETFFIPPFPIGCSSFILTSLIINDDFRLAAQSTAETLY